MNHILVSDPNKRFTSDEAKARVTKLIKTNYPLPLMAKKQSGNLLHLDGFHLWFHAQKDPPGPEFAGFSFSI